MLRRSNQRREACDSIVVPLAGIDRAAWAATAACVEELMRATTLRRAFAPSPSAARRTRSVPTTHIQRGTFDNMCPAARACDAATGCGCGPARLDRCRRAEELGFAATATGARAATLDLVVLTRSGLRAGVTLAALASRKPASA